jgi:glycosyltransferase WbpL
MPNFRSSHAQPTPHGGGVGIVLGGTGAGLLLAVRTDSTLFWVILGLSLVIASMGLLDDIRQVPASMRLGLQTVACSVLMVNASGVSWGLPPSALTVGSLGLGVLMLVAGTWWINLFNFMDGIDGMAVTQAIFMLGAGITLGAVFHPPALQTGPWIWMAALTIATLPFLIHNWPPARIFMGDVGSTYLAFMILALAMISVRDGWLSYPCWLILGALFVTDATVTLLYRMLTGQQWTEAHCSHAYQRLSRLWDSHRHVTLLAIGVNVLWLAPLAWVSLAWPRSAFSIVAMAYTPLVAGVIFLGGGRRDDA